jgi:hypothetical protein
VADTVRVNVELPWLPEGVDRRLHSLLDKQDQGESLTEDERAEAEGLVELSEFLTLLRLRASAHAG